MSELNIEQFNPTVAELTELVEKTKGITATDLEDKKQLEVVKRGSLDLRNAQIRVEKAGKELRASALKFQKDVIAKENELTGIVEVELQRLKGILAGAEKLAEMKLRKLQLPEHKERLMKAGLGSIATEEELLGMDSVQFENFFTEAVAEKEKEEIEEQQRKNAEKDAELRAREEKVLEAERKIEEEARAKVREEKAREDERTRMEKEQADALAKKEAEEKQALAEEARKKELLEKQKKYVAYRASLGYTKETAGDFNEDTVDGEIIIWKKVGVFKLK